MADGTEGTAGPETVAALLQAANADRAAKEVRAALGDLMAQPKDDRAPMQAVIAEALLPHFAACASRASESAHTTVKALAERAVHIALEHAFASAEACQAQGVQIGKARAQLMEAAREHARAQWGI
jgi:hypothetical protein